MPKKRRRLKMIALYIVIILVLILIGGSLFINFSPQFGKGLTKEQKKNYASLENFDNGHFLNQSPTPMDVNAWRVFKEMIKGSSNRKPQKNINVEKAISKYIISQSDSISTLTWFGHSTFLLEMEGKKIIIDPMFGKSPSPLSLIRPGRYSKELPVDIEALAFIDAVIISHDHYDHLDYKSILKLKGKVGHYYTPLGVANHLISWGVPKEKITELNWWESAELDSIDLVCTPARHFSGRGIFNRSNTLWCSWVIKGKDESIFFSGDSGYDKHFKEIGDKYGPFEISLMECGQYNIDWKFIHMMPEESAQAAVDLRSKLILPIHWGAFTLAFHHWTDPIERILQKANELNIPVTTPKIGEKFAVGDKNFPIEKWWLDY